jgi:hypothetical protein
MVGSMSASDGAHKIQMVPAGGSSRVLSNTLEERSAMRSASSIIIIWYLLIDPPKYEAATKLLISSIEIMTFSVASTVTSGCDPKPTMRQLLQSPQPPDSQSIAAANAAAAFDLPEPGGPVISQACCNPASLFATAWRS